MKGFRYVMRVQWRDGAWDVVHRPLRAGRPKKDGSDVFVVSPHWKRVSDATVNAQSRGRHLWENYRIPAQVVVHKRDGTIAKEFTYGLDPKRRKG